MIPVRRDNWSRFGAIVVLAATVLTACGGPGTSASSSASSASSGASAGTDTSKRFTVVSGSFDLAELPYLGALDDLRAKGYSIDYVQVPSTDISVDGVSKGQFQFAADAVNVWMSAIQKGVPAKMILQRRYNDWQMWVANDIKSCEDLDGRTLAIHSEVSLTTAMVRQYVKENCPQAKPNYVIIEGSDNRLAAMIADQVDATALELVDVLHLKEEAGDRYHLLTSFADSLPKLSSNVEVVNADFAAKNPTAVNDLVEAVIAAHRKVAEDPHYLLQLAEKYPSMVTSQPSDEALQGYATLFPLDGGLTDDIVSYSIDFFTNTGLLKPGLKPTDVADLSYIDHALKDLGPAK